MKLDETQKQKVAQWVAEGLKLSDIQKRMETDLGLRVTYMELRFLVDDLKVMPKDIERSRPADLGRGNPATPRGPGPTQAPPTPPGGPSQSNVTVSVDAVTRAGALVSGTVRFSDGNSAGWYLDQTGRLGLIPQQQGYKPSPADLQAFQTELQSELQRLGF